MLARRLAPRPLFIAATLLFACSEPGAPVHLADAAGSVQARGEIKDPWRGAEQPGPQVISAPPTPHAALSHGELRDPFASDAPAAASAAVDAPAGELRDPFGAAPNDRAAPPQELRDPFAPRPPKASTSAPPPSSAPPLGPPPGATIAALQDPSAPPVEGADSSAEDDDEALEEKAQEERRARREREAAAKLAAELAAAEAAPQ